MPYCGVHYLSTFLLYCMSIFLFYILSNHLEERLFEQAQGAGVVIPPPFLGVIRVAYPKA